MSKEQTKLASEIDEQINYGGGGRNSNTLRTSYAEDRKLLRRGLHIQLDVVQNMSKIACNLSANFPSSREGKK